MAAPRQYSCSDTRACLGPTGTKYLIVQHKCSFPICNGNNSSVVCQYCFDRIRRTMG